MASLPLSSYILKEYVFCPFIKLDVEIELNDIESMNFVLKIRIALRRQSSSTNGIHAKISNHCYYSCREYSQKSVLTNIQKFSALTDKFCNNRDFFSAPARSGCWCSHKTDPSWSHIAICLYSMVKRAALVMRKHSMRTQLLLKQCANNAMGKLCWYEVCQWVFVCVCTVE